MSNPFKKMIKKKELISDSGVHIHDNLIDVIVILVCAVVVVGLIFLGVMAYLT